LFYVSDTCRDIQKYVRLSSGAKKGKEKSEEFLLFDIWTTAWRHS